MHGYEFLGVIGFTRDLSLLAESGTPSRRSGPTSSFLCHSGAAMAPSVPGSPEWNFSGGLADPTAFRVVRTSVVIEQ